MFDQRARKIIDPYLLSVGKKLANRGFTANSVTVTGFFVGGLAAATIVSNHMWLALILILTSRLCDGLDGAIAKINGPSDFGGYLDIVLDFAFYGMIPTAFAFSNPPENSTAAIVLVLSFYINGASFLAYSSIAEKRGVETVKRGSKSLLYHTGLAEASETLVVFVAFCLFPTWFSAIAWAFAAICFYSAFARIMQARAEFR